MNKSGKEPKTENPVIKKIDGMDLRFQKGKDKRVFIKEINCPNIL